MEADSPRQGLHQRLRDGSSPHVPGVVERQRLDRLPFSRQHGKLLLGSGIGWALDAMDVGLISFVMAALAAQWKLDATTLGFIGSIGFVGMALGASLGGLLADRVSPGAALLTVTAMGLLIGLSSVRVPAR